MWWKALIISITAVVITACSVSDNSKINIISKEYETEYSQIKTQVPEINIPGAPEFSKELNSRLLQENEEAVSGFDSDAAQNSDSMQKSIYEIKQEIKYNKNNFISITEEQYTYIGGAHGMTLRKSLNIDTLLNKEILLGDLFAEEGYEQTLNRLIREKREKHPEEYSELWEEPVIKPEHQYDFYITDTDLVIYYQPYALSYYARGFIEFPIRLTELSGYLKEEYYRLIGE